MTERKDDPYSFNQSGSDTELLISLILVQYTNTYGSIKSFTDSHIKQRVIPTTSLYYFALSKKMTKREEEDMEIPPFISYRD